MIFERRDYQKKNTEDVAKFIAKYPLGGRLLNKAPTGAGKSLMLLDALAADPEGVATVPRVEIGYDMLKKLGYEEAKLEAASENAILTAMEAERIYTPIKLRNMLAEGLIHPLPSRWYMDEAHHSEAPSYKELEAYLCGSTQIGYTATDFRGTIRGTKAFRDYWGETNVTITLQECEERGYISFPEIRIWPLVDDDLITITAGEFTVSSSSKAVASRYDDLIACIQEAKLYDATKWKRPTMFALPSKECCDILQTKMSFVDLPTAIVNEATTRRERKRIFREVVAGNVALLQINVVSEGIDLPIRVLIDCDPKMSPVEFLQQLGRDMRPVGLGEAPPLYICTNRNLFRHCYLLEGLVPSTVVAEASTAFPTTSKSRLGGRVLGLEAIGKLKPSELPLRNNIQGFMYVFESWEGRLKTRYAVLCHPTQAEPLYAKRNDTRNSLGEVSYGKWEAISELPSDLRGFASVSGREPSDAQKAWWKRCAKYHGLDPEAKVTRKSFDALPILNDLGAKIL